MTEHLAELWRQVRGDTIQLLAAAAPNQLLFAPAGTSNHILWHAGHALWLADVLCVELITGHSELPAGWAEMFGMDCRPVRLTRDWPEKAEVLRLLTAQRERVLELLAQLSPERLGAQRSSGRRSLAQSIIHGFHDEAKHQGEMYLLYKMSRQG